MASPRPAGTLVTLAALVATSWLSRSFAAPAIRMEPAASLRAEVVLTGPDLPGTIGFLEVESLPGQPATASIDLPWPAGARLALRLAGDFDSSATTVEAEVTVVRGDEALSRTARRLAVGGSSSTIWEVHRAQGRRILLGVRVERLARPAVPPPPRVGAQVAFRLFVERVQGDAITLLETNDLNTFVGEPVSYSFRRGAGIEEERIRVGVSPLRILDDVVQVSLDLEARLPGEDAPPPFRRTQTLFVTRGVESRVVVATGDPPSGYRFRLVAEF
jgi:hypothetical protein